MEEGAWYGWRCLVANDVWILVVRCKSEYFFAKTFNFQEDQDYSRAWNGFVPDLEAELGSQVWEGVEFEDVGHDRVVEGFEGEEFVRCYRAL